MPSTHQAHALTAREIGNSTAKIFSDFDKQHKQLMKQLNIGTAATTTAGLSQNLTQE